MGSASFCNGCKPPSKRSVWMGRMGRCPVVRNSFRNRPGVLSSLAVHTRKTGGRQSFDNKSRSGNDQSQMGTGRCCDSAWRTNRAEEVGSVRTKSVEAGGKRSCCTDRLQFGTRPTRDGIQAVRSKLGRPSSVIRFSTLTPILASVFWFSKLRAFSFGPMTVFRRPIKVSPRLR